VGNTITALNSRNCLKCLAIQYWPPELNQAENNATLVNKPFSLVDRKKLKFLQLLGNCIGFEIF